MHGFRARTYLVVSLSVAALLSGCLTGSHPAFAAASIHVPASTTSAGSTVIVDGFGFHAGDTAVVSATFNTVHGVPQRIALAVPVGPRGTFVAGLPVPAQATPGQYLLEARDFHGGVSSRPITVLSQIILRAGTASGPFNLDADIPFYVRGSGFLAHEPVRVSADFPLYDGNTVVLNRNLVADAGGHVSNLVSRVPAGARRDTVTFTATGGASRRIATARAVVTYHPLLRASPAAVQPGTSVTLYGSRFVPLSTVRVSITLTRASGARATSTRDVRADVSGAFAVALSLIPDVRAGTYTVSARDLRAGLEALTHVQVSVHPTLSLQPNTAVPGQTVGVSGGGFGTRVSVQVVARFTVAPGGSRLVIQNATTHADGSFYVSVTVPPGAVAGPVEVSARSSAGYIATRLQVVVPPTATPAPTATPTPTPTPRPRTASLRFQYVSLWYHPIHEGAYDHLVVQAQPRRHLAIWVHIIYPDGLRQSMYSITDRDGYWATDFQVPRRVVVRWSDQAVATFQLWKGHRTRKSFIQFRVLR